VYFIAINSGKYELLRIKMDSWAQKDQVKLITVVSEDLGLNADSSELIH